MIMMPLPLLRPPALRTSCLRQGRMCASLHAKIAASSVSAAAFRVASRNSAVLAASAFCSIGTLRVGRLYRHQDAIRSFSLISKPFHSCMRLGHPRGLSPSAPQLLMPRQQSGLHQRRVVSNAVGYHNAQLSTCSSSSCNHEHHHHHHHRQEQQHSGGSRHQRSTAAHAAAGSATWDSQQDLSSASQDSSKEQQQQQCCGGEHAHEHTHNHSHGHAHGHHHHHHHGHGHGHSHGHGHGHAHHHHHHHGGCNHHHHHFHSDAASQSSNPVLSALAKTGLFSVAEHLEHNVAYTVTSIACFTAALLLPYAAAQSVIPAAAAALLAKAALSVTYLLSGLPQLAETVYAAVAGKIDTHVLMSLSVLGTLYMGMAQEGALLLLLFRGSHQLEHRLTEKAAGSLQRLFDSVPDRAVVVEVEPGSNAPKVATSQEVAASAVTLGQHVLVRPGEQVPLDGIITWGTANLSLQHISGEAQPVKLGPGQEVPAGSLSTDGLLVVRVIAAAENSTPARIAQLAAEAQATRPQLTRWLDSVGTVWSKAVIGATLLTAAVLPFLGVPFLGDRGALYRAMGVLTAGSPCALALVPLAYACAIAAITARGILVKSGSAIDALAACKTIALDKTGTITTGSLNLAEGFVITAAAPSSSRDSLSQHEPAAGSSSSSDGGSAASGQPIHVRAMQGLAELCQRVTGSSSSRGASLGTTTGFNGSAFDSDDYALDDVNLGSAGAAAAVAGGGSGSSSAGLSGSDGTPGFDVCALKCAVALSRLSNHPVSRAMVDSAPNVDGDVSVLSFEQVPGAGVQGVCRIGDGRPVHVMFGGADWINSHVSNTSLTSSLNTLLQQHHNRPSRATAVLSIAQLLPAADGASAAPAAAQEPQELAGRWDAAAAAAPAGPEQQLGASDDAAVLLGSNSRPGTPQLSSSRPGSPFRYKGSQGNRDGSTTFSFEEEADELTAVQASNRWDEASSLGTGTDSGPLRDIDSSTISSRSSSLAGSSGSRSSSSSGVSSSSGWTVDSELARQQQQQQRVLQAYGSPGQPTQLALLCFEDIIQPGVPAAVQQLQSGSWSDGSSSSWWGRGSSNAAKDVVMLTGDNKGVAEAVAHAVGISTYKAGLKPEDKLSYVRQAAAEAAGGSSSSKEGDERVSVSHVAAATGGAAQNGLLMAGDGINDAPALAAAQVGVAIASTPKDMVAAAADIIVLNGQGITNLPWLFHVANRTHTILRQNLALAVVSVVFATVPTVAGFFPLWLAVTLHEGSTLLVALNSLRLLLESGKHSGGPAPPPKVDVTSSSSSSNSSGPQLAAAQQS